jgi:hypothetical protein
VSTLASVGVCSGQQEAAEVAVAVAEAAEASAARAVLSRSRPSLEEQLHTRGELEFVPQIFFPQISGLSERSL